MLKSKELYGLISGTSLSDYYAYKDNTVFIDSEPVCKIYKDFAFFKFDLSNEYIEHELDCFLHGLTIPVFPVPPSLFYFNMLEVDSLVAGECWISFFETLIKDCIDSGSYESLRFLNIVIDSYVHFYSTNLNVGLPENAQLFLRGINIDEIEKSCIDEKLRIHRKNFEPLLFNWRLFNGKDTLHNHTKFEYIRFNKIQNRFETTLGFYIDVNEMEQIIQRYNTGNDFMFEATSFQPNEHGIEQDERHSFSATILDNGDINVGCSVIKKEEFLNIKTNGK